MAWALAGDRTPTTYEFTGAATTTTITLAAACALGSLGTLRWLTSGASAFPTSASDSKGNTYQLDKAQANGTSETLGLFSVRFTTALAIGDTITVNHASANERLLSVHEWTGGPTSGWLDVVTATTGSWSSAALPNGSATTTGSSDLVFGAIGLNNFGWNSITQPTGYTVMTERFGAAAADLWGGYQLNKVAATYTYNPTPGTATSIAGVDIVVGYSLTAIAGGSTVKTLAALGVG